VGSFFCSSAEPSSLSRQHSPAARIPAMACEPPPPHCEPHPPTLPEPAKMPACLTEQRCRIVL
jgi:hypothetical protein